MTIDSQYQRESFGLVPSQTYVFTFEHIGPEAITVYEANADGDLTFIQETSYTLTTPGTHPIETGGTVQFVVPHLTDSVSVVVIRSTPTTQLIDYNAYQRFPAETHEFALDKLTMIVQEAIDGLGLTGIGGGDLDPNNFVPITGTNPGNPITGLLEFNNNSILKNWFFGIVQGFGIDDMVLFPQGNPTTCHEFAIVTNDGAGMSYNYEFKCNGELLLDTDYTNPSPDAAATVQYVQDYVGGPGAAFIPLAGTVVSEEVTGTITWLDAGSNASFNFGYAAGLTDAYGFYSNTPGENFIIGLGDPNTFIFDATGPLLLPTIDYSISPAQSAATKQYVDDQVSGGGNVYVPLAGTDPGFEIKGDHHYLNSTVSEEWIIGIWENDDFGTKGFQIRTGPTTNTADFMVLNNANVLKFSHEGFLGVNNADPQVALDVEGDCSVSGFIGAGNFPVSDPVDELCSINSFGVLTQSDLQIQNVMTLDTNQTVTGQKTHTQADIFPNVALTGMPTNDGSEIVLMGHQANPQALCVKTTLTPDKVMQTDEDETITGTHTFNITPAFAGVIAAGNGQKVAAINSFGQITFAAYDQEDVVINTRQVNSGDGLNGGGNLSANRTLSVDSTVIRTAGNQSMSGVKTFTSTPVFNAGASAVGNISADGLAASNLTPVGAALEAGGFGLVVPASCDGRLKRDIHDNITGIELVMEMHPVFYTWNEGLGKPVGEQLGFIAQEMEQVLPSAAPYDAETDTYGVNDRPIVAALVKAVQEQQAQIRRLEDKLEALTNG